MGLCADLTLSDDPDIERERGNALRSSNAMECAPLGSTSCLLLIAAFWLFAPLAAQTLEAGAQQAEPTTQEESAQPEERSRETQPELTEEIVAVGTRAQPRTVTESAVPIDVISSKDFFVRGETEVADLLRNE